MIESNHRDILFKIQDNFYEITMYKHLSYDKSAYNLKYTNTTNHQH